MSDDREGSLVGVTLGLTRDGDEVAVRSSRAVIRAAMRSGVTGSSSRSGCRADKNRRVVGGRVTPCVALELDLTNACSAARPEAEARRGRGRSRGGDVSMLFG